MRRALESNVSKDEILGLAADTTRCWGRADAEMRLLRDAIMWMMREPSAEATHRKYTGERPAGNNGGTCPAEWMLSKSLDQPQPAKTEQAVRANIRII